MKRLLLGLSICLLSLPLAAQTYVKINGLYAMAGVINPAVEFRLSPHSSFQTELVISPWKSIHANGIENPMLFGIFMNEYRYHFKPTNKGWYVGLNAGAMIFNMTKPNFFSEGSVISLKPNSSKGYGVMFGASVGHKWIFKEKFMLDAFVGFGYLASYYNGYSLIDGLVEGGRVYNKGELILTPHRKQQPDPLDPFNGSAEWLPNKIGLSFGVLIFDPKRNR